MVYFPDAKEIVDNDKVILSSALIISSWRWGLVLHSRLLLCFISHLPDVSHCEMNCLTSPVMPGQNMHSLALSGDFYANMGEIQAFFNLLSHLVRNKKALTVEDKSVPHAQIVAVAEVVLVPRKLLLFLWPASLNYAFRLLQDLVVASSALVSHRQQLDSIKEYRLSLGVLSNCYK